MMQAAERAALEAENGALRDQLAELAQRVEAAAEAEAADAADVSSSDPDAASDVLKVSLLTSRTDGLHLHMMMRSIPSVAPY